MTDEGLHPSDEALAAWVDARIDGDPALVETARTVTAHLVECASCRAVVSELQQIIAALRDEAAALDPAAFGENAARVLAAVGTSTPARGRRARWWIPAAAAAALAALLVARAGDDGRSPTVIASSEPLPVIVAAERAAVDAAAAIEASGADSVDDTILVAAVATTTDMAIDDAELLDEFTSLPTEDQEAILTELALVEFDL